MKFLKIISFLLLISFSGFSQSDRFENEHYLGVRFGYNMHFIINDASYIDGPDYGINYGIVYKNFLERVAGTYLGLNYVQKGGYGYFTSNENLEPLDSIVIFRHRLEYLEIPILMNLRLGKKRSRINLYGGPSISYLIKQKILFVGDDPQASYCKTETNKNFEFAINGGAGYSFNFNKGMLELNVIYTHSLTNIFEPQTVNNTLFNQTQMVTASLNYYYKF